MRPAGRSTSTSGRSWMRWRAHPTTRVLSNMLHSEIDGDRLTRQEIASNLKVMIVGGLQATSDLIALSLLTLLQHPDQLAEVMADHSLIDPAIEEAVRWHAPVGTSTRQTTREIELSGVRLPAGALVAAVLAAANRDSRNYTDPDRFDIHRREGGRPVVRNGPAPLHRRPPRPLRGPHRPARAVRAPAEPAARS